MLSRERHFFVLAAVTPEIKSGARDVDVDAVAPRWPCAVLDPGADVVYELRLIPASSIALVTRFVQKVRTASTEHADTARSTCRPSSTGRSSRP